MAASRPPLDVFTIGEGGHVADPDGRWLAAYGVEANGAVLIRPDGHVAWRTQGRPADPARALQDTLGRILNGVPDATAVAS